MGLFLCLLAAGTVLVLAYPYLVSAYHVEAGGLAMDSLEYVSSKTPEALEHLLKAIKWDRGNAQAYHLLASIYRAQGDWPSAVEAATRYAELRPGHPLAHVALAEIYEEMEAERGAGPSTSAGGLTSPEQMVAAWRRAGFNTGDMLALGEQARDDGSYGEARLWYERAAQLSPELGDPWYYLGLLFEKQQQWPEALEALEKATASSSFRQVHRSSPSYRLGMLYQRQFDPPLLENALAAFKAAMAADDFESSAEAADCSYRLGDVQRLQGADPSIYLPAYQRATELTPRHAWAHARLGEGYYTHEQDAAKAEVELLRAVELAPDAKWFRVMLGDLYRQEGQSARARLEYRQALEIDPDFQAAQKRLEAMGDEE